MTRKQFGTRRPALWVAIALVGAPFGVRAETKAPAPRKPPVISADLEAVRKTIGAPGAAAVLVNVWATWCEPCRDEMPELLRVYRGYRARGLRLVLISADEEEDRDKAARFLGSLGVDFPSWLKRGDDMAFIDGLDRRWSGALPASFLYDGQGRVQHFWQGEISGEIVERALQEVLKLNGKSRNTGKPAGKPTGRNP